MSGLNKLHIHMKTLNSNASHLQLEEIMHQVNNVKESEKNNILFSNTQDSDDEFLCKVAQTIDTNSMDTEAKINSNDDDDDDDDDDEFLCKVAQTIDTNSIDTEAKINSNDDDEFCKTYNIMLEAAKKWM
ncbi:uncharacterized protein LOC126897513 [Daktulosphaira vitifoliae]|uniref:uncharacterized protein LOC126897513 n=1 Tax=Daktulosphaira vitifoliae TaxID=58002 RepID=UPI0021AAEB77|nr:uncharacterized protein LOC126897513 [Daktulosphaira vitifoliae]